jgi:hypothetical protein
VSQINPSEGTAQSDHCRRFYPIARDVLLEKHAWRFATVRESLALLEDTPPAGWTLTYAKPNLCIKPLVILLPEETDDDNGQPFIVESLTDGTEVIYTNTEDAVIRFIILRTDPTKFTPLFVNALAWLLASYLSGPITKDPKVKESCYKMFLKEFGDAAMSDANASYKKTIADFKPNHLTNR